MYLPVIEAQAAKSGANEQFPTAVRQIQNRDTSKKFFFVCYCTECNGDLVGDSGDDLFFITGPFRFFFFKQPWSLEVNEFGICD